MFKEEFDKYNWDYVLSSIYYKSEADVVRALGKARCDIEDFKALISPAAAPFLEQMAQKSNALTQKRFGKTHTTLPLETYPDYTPEHKDQAA